MKTVTVHVDLLKNLVDTARKFQFNNIYVLEAQLILDKLNKEFDNREKGPTPCFDEDFLKEVVRSEQLRGQHVVADYVKELEGKK